MPPRTPSPRAAARPKRRRLAIILAAGMGKRLPGPRPKVLVECLGEPLLEHVRRAVAAIRPDETLVVVGHMREAVCEWLAAHWPKARAVVQEPQNGTGHAVRVALDAAPTFVGEVVVVCGDVPQLLGSHLTALLDAHRGSEATATVLVGRDQDPGQLGRVVRSEDGRITRIVEAKDASAEELAIREFNTGIYAFDAVALRGAVADLPKQNAQGEQYLTDAVGALAKSGRVAAAEAREGHALLGVNTAEDLSHAYARLRRREIDRHRAAGVQIVDVERTVIEAGVEIAPGARILPFTLIGHGSKIGPDCVVGPFAHLRGGTVLKAGAQVGNFVEVKATTLGEGAKAKHLTYLGDADVGAGANVGCGTITANYDGVRKHRTKIGAKARIGSGTVLVAPVTVGAGAVTGANAVILAGKHVPAGRTAVGVPARTLAEKRPAGTASKTNGSARANSTRRKGRAR